MPTDVRVGRLRVRSQRHLCPDVAAAAQQVEAIDLPSALTADHSLPDHSVLVVRRLCVVDGDRGGARRALADLRRDAARPLDGRVDSRAEAVLFVDAADLLLTLTRDVLEGKAAQAWYWRGLFPRGRSGGLLAAAWLDHARWVPAVLGRVWQGRAADALRAVSLLDDGAADAVRSAVLTEFGRTLVRGDAPQPLRERVSGLDADQLDACPPTREVSVADALRPYLRAADVATLRPAAAALLAAAVRLADGMFNRPAAGTDPVATGSAVQPADVVPNHRPSVIGPEPRASNADPDSREEAVAGGTVAPDDAAAPLPERGPVTTAPRPLAAVSPSWRTHEPDRPPGVVRDLADPDDSVFPRLAGERTASGLASALYVVNLLPHLGITGPSRRDGLRAWAAVEELARWASRAALDPLLLHDPLWGLLRNLDGRPPGTPSRQRLGRRMGAARELLAGRRVRVAAFRRPGVIISTATHIDVVLDLNDIDVSARLAGLDRDPGWVPEFGHIVAFHFVAGGAG